jgi:hypothetical protein
MSILLNDIQYLNNGVKQFDHGLFLEKLWLLIFNYKKNNKHYIPLKIKDYLIFDKKLIIDKDNSVHFKIFIITCQIFIELYIDNKYYKLFISRSKISFKNYHQKKLVHYCPRLNKKIQDLLKDMSDLDIHIFLKNNIFKVFVNKMELINYKFLNNVFKITDAKILSLTKDNNLKNVIK